MARCSDENFNELEKLIIILLIQLPQKILKSKSMKIAYLITTYNNSKHLNRLIKSLQRKNAYFFIHADKKSNYKFKIQHKPNIIIIRSNISVYWGGYSMINAELLLINKALEYSNFDYFVLLSGTDYPIRSNTFIFDFFRKNYGKEFINLHKMPKFGKEFSRIEYYYIESDRRINIISLFKRIINKMIRILNLKRKFPTNYSHLTLYGGETWWALTKKCVVFITEYIKENSELKHFYKNVLVPEELFFHTIIGNSNFKENVSESVTYIDWQNPKSGHPDEISDKHLSIFHKNEISFYGHKKAPILFARKFSDNSTILLNKIDQLYRKEV